MTGIDQLGGAGGRDVFAPTSLGEGLRLLRQRCRYSRDQLAREAGVSGGAISNYENGVSVPPAPTLRQIARALAEALDLDVAELWEQLGTILDREGHSRPAAAPRAAAQVDA